MDKQELRRKIISQRKNFTSKEKNSSDLTILKKLIQTPEFQTAKKILVYFSLPDEVDTLTLIKKFIHKKELCAPRIQKNPKRMTIHAITSLENLKKNHFKILEPPANSPEIAPENIDFALIPGVAFDERCHRLGFGQGYYDRLLPHFTCPKIALAYDFQIVTQLPIDDHDRPVDIIVTPTRIIKRNL